MMAREASTAGWECLKIWSEILINDHGARCAEEPKIT